LYQALGEGVGETSRGDTAMKDLVLQGFVTSFAEERGMTGVDESTVFEAFSVSSVLRKFHQCDAAEIEEFLTGGSGDGGIDAVAILVNGHPAKTKEDVDFFIEKLRRLDVEFVFIQAKTSASFESSSIGTLVHGVNQFFSADPTIDFRSELENLRQLKDYIYHRSIAMERNPRCCLYYVSTGVWNNDPEPRSRFEDGKIQLEKTKLFSKIDTTPVDSERLKNVYRELERGVIKEVEFSKTAVFPRVDGVREAYIGLMAGDQFIHLVTTDDGELNRDLFYDNVRDFQGNNPVNQEIDQTLKNNDSIGRFPLLNNGVTIVARSVNRTGEIFKISDFQIVNGCQTSHILYQNRGTVNAEAFVPVKLVVTDDSDVIAEVIKATNRQTAVLPEALESLSPFHKELEDFYAAQHAGVKREDRIYYERRSKQYAFDIIRPINIITLTAQTKSFLAMFLNEPHSHPRYYGELLKAYESRLFVHDHKPAPYYLSGFAFSAVEHLFNSGHLDRSMKSWRYHVLMLLRMQMAGVDVPPLNSNRVVKYSLEIVEQLKSKEALRRNCEVAIETILSELKKFEISSAEHSSRLRAFTIQLIEAAKAPRPKEASKDDEPVLGSTENGKIKWFNDEKGFGFIGRDAGGDIFVHRTGIRHVPWYLRHAGTRVTYTISQNRSGWLAEDVKLDVTE
jgi:cold shock CspA family protein